MYKKIFVLMAGFSMFSCTTTSHRPSTNLFNEIVNCARSSNGNALNSQCRDKYTSESLPFIGKLYSIEQSYGNKYSVIVAISEDSLTSTYKEAVYCYVDASSKEISTLKSIAVKDSIQVLGKLKSVSGYASITSISLSDCSFSKPEAVVQGKNP